MIEATINFDLIDKRLKRTAKAIERMVGAPDEAKYWPEVRNKMRSMLISNLDEIHNVPIKRRTREAKIKAAKANRTVRRLKSGGAAPIQFPRTDWKSTGILEEVFKVQFATAPLNVMKTSNSIDFTIAIDTSMFVNDKISGKPYPEAVDEDLRSRTSGDIGLVNLTEMQKSEILEMLIKKNESLVERLYGGVKGAIGRFFKR